MGEEVRRPRTVIRGRKIQAGVTLAELLAVLTIMAACSAITLQAVNAVRGTVDRFGSAYRESAIWAESEHVNLPSAYGRLRTLSSVGFEASGRLSAEQRTAIDRAREQARSLYDREGTERTSNNFATPDTSRRLGFHYYEGQ